MAFEASDPLGVLAESARTGTPARLHIADGEVIVARILEHGPTEVVYAVITSSRPEKYAVCDATGFIVPLDAIRSAVLLAPSSRSRRGKAKPERGTPSREI
jgi:hypothetical protein